MEQTNNNKRIAKNSMLLYLRMLLTMGITLYTSRIVLSELGVSDFGVYNVIGGVVMLFSSLNTAMASAVQRFMNFEMGRKNHQRLRDVFNTSVIIHFYIAAIVFILLESVGVWFVNYSMKIDPEKIIAANWVLQFSILTFVVGVMSVPYNAVIIANEKMKAFAFITIIEVLLKLLVAFSIGWMSFDKLKVYAVLMFLVSIAIRFIYTNYASRKFEECRFKWKWDKALFREMTSFAGWNLIGVSSTLIRTQGINVVLNLFFGTIVNAAMGIANQVKVSVDNFTNNFLTAIAPQITKSYAANDFDYLMKLIFRGSKYTTFLILLITLPILVETEYLMSIWLQEVPPYTVDFVRLILITGIIDSISKTLIQTMFATGKVKKYQIIVGSVTMMNLPVSIVFLYLGYDPQITMTIGIIVAVIALFVRLFMLKSMIGLNVRKFIFRVIFRVTGVSVFAVAVPVIISMTMDQGFIRLIMNSLLCVISVGIMVYLIGLSGNEKSFVINKVKDIIHKKIKRK